MYPGCNLTYTGCNPTYPGRKPIHLQACPGEKNHVTKTGEKKKRALLLL